MSDETVVIEYIEGVPEVPDALKVMVEQYNRRRAIVDASESYPRSLDREMDALYDAMVVVVASLGVVRTAAA